MKRRFVLCIILLAAGLVQQLDAQTEKALRRADVGKTGASLDELVSFKSDVAYSKAIQLLGELSKKIEGKIFIDRSPMQGKDKMIGINIESMYWKDAFELILRSNQLWYNDYPEYLEIISFEDVGKQLGEQAPKDAGKTPTVSALVDSSEIYSKMHEVTISSIFLDINRTKLAESGITLSFFRGANLNLGVKLSGAEKVTKQALSASVTNATYQSMTLNAAINMFESDALAEVLARPQITVRSGQTSSFQIGSDFSIFQKDFSGNIAQVFYPTGTILTVNPKVYKVGDIDFVNVAYKIEKSTFEASAVTTVVNKTLAAGSLILLNGEEGYVGGMYSNEETTVREGVPLLKDLPWWVFGLRYIFGYNSNKIVKRELIVLIKAEMLPSIEERAKEKGVRNVFRDVQQELRKDLETRIKK